MRNERPLIGVICDRREIGRHPFHMVGEKYLEAITHGAGGVPVAVPVLGGDFDVREILPRLDGLMLTGSPSNVEPRRYGGVPSRAGTLHDPARDTAAMRQAALAAGMAAAADTAHEDALPHAFVELGVATHLQFDSLGAAIGAGLSPDSAIARLGPITANCVSCHKTYRLEVGGAAH